MSKKSKWLYHFAVPAMVEQEIEIDPTEDKEGNQIKQFKTIKKETPVKCAIKKPTRGTYEEGELFYSVELSKYIQAGMLTKTLLAKRFANDGGALSDHEQNHYSEVYSLLHTKEQEIQRAQLDTASVKKRAKKLQRLLLEVTSLRQQLVEFESSQSALFDQTAEHKARNKAILWWVLNLSYIKDEENSEGKEGEKNFRELFPGETTKDKLEAYDVYEEEEEFQEGASQGHISLALKKFAYFISFWYSGQAVDKDGFKAAEDLLQEVDFFQGDEKKGKEQELLKEHVEKQKSEAATLAEITDPEESEVEAEPEEAEVEAEPEEAEVKAEPEEAEVEAEPEEAEVKAEPEEAEVKAEPEESAKSEESLNDLQEECLQMESATKTPTEDPKDV